MNKFYKSILVFCFSITLSCSPSTPKLIAEPATKSEKVFSDTDLIVFTPQVDILFVVDNSGSMEAHQNTLSYNMSKFVSAFSSKMQVDYHLGVISTDMFGRTESGRLQGYPSFVDRNTPNGLQAFARNILLGTDGDPEEKSFDPVFAALSKPIVDNENAGFLRPDAYLAIVYITDAEDQSRMDQADLYQFLVKLKKYKEKVLSYGVIVPSGVSDYKCSRDSYGTYPKRIENFLTMVINNGKNVMSLCDPDYGAALAELSKDLVKYIGGTIYLNRPPVLSTVKIVYGTQEIPKDHKRGWSFDPARNALILGDDIEWTQQPEGTKVQVYYETAVIEN